MSRLEILDALEKNTIYDYIAANYYKISKEDLATLIKEIEFVIFSKYRMDEEINKDVAQSLIEDQEWGEE